MVGSKRMYFLGISDNIHVTRILFEVDMTDSNVTSRVIPPPVENISIFFIILERIKMMFINVYK